MDALPFEPPSPAAGDVSIGDFLALLSTGLTQRIEQARAIVAAKQAELDTANRNLKTLEKLQAVQQGATRSPQDISSTPSQPRASKAEGLAMQEQIMDLLRPTGADGMAVADIIRQIAPQADAKGQQAARNVLALMKRNSRIGGRDGLYFLPG